MSPQERETPSRKPRRSRLNAGRLPSRGISETFWTGRTVVGDEVVFVSARVVVVMCGASRAVLVTGPGVMSMVNVPHGRDASATRALRDDLSPGPSPAREGRRWWGEL